MTTADRDAFDRKARGPKANGYGSVAPLPIWDLSAIRHLPAPSWVLPGLIPARAKTLVFGPSGSFKSTSVVALACSIAHGIDVAGIVPDETLPALFVAAEDAEGLAANVLAWHESRGREDGPVKVAPADGLGLAQPEALGRLMATAELAFPGQPYGLVLDHWDLLAGADLNDANAVTPALATLDQLLAGRCRYVVMLAHTPWEQPDRVKGSVLVWNNHATRIRAKAEPGALTSSLQVVHHKRGRSGGVLAFSWQEVDGGIVPREIQAENAAPVRKGPTGANQRLAFDCLHRTVAERPERHPGHADIPQGARLARYEVVAEMFVRMAAGEDEPWRKRDHFKRAVAAMQARHLVKHVDGWLWA